jgi:FtsP/CotA-like multicopper oxidase with cupredoxin domain
MGQRIDIRLRLPNAQGAWPILALRSGAIERTGFVLATSKGEVRRVPAAGAAPLPPLDLTLESRLRAALPLPGKQADRHDTMILGGSMAPYVWTFDGRTWGQHRPLRVRHGQRVELTLRNDSHMDHPIHLHGHELQVVSIDGKPIAGAVRDTIWLPTKSAVTVVFDANNPGPQWALHCHHLYHMATGMMTAVAYEL